ncbi:MAG: DUF1553 domain-containing protein [Pirellulaceae bacterium]
MLDTRLVDWMADPSNPFFAKALVNRYWKHFFGRRSGRSRGRHASHQSGGEPGLARRARAGLH